MSGEAGGDRGAFGWLHCRRSCPPYSPAPGKKDGRRIIGGWLSQLPRRQLHFGIARKRHGRSTDEALPPARETMTVSSADPSEGNDAWTFVRSKKRRPGTNPPAKQPAKPASAGLPTPAAATLTPGEIELDQRRIQSQWLASASCRRLEELVRTRKPDAPVSTAVCLGIGTFDPDDGSWPLKRRTHVQLAAFETIVAALRGRPDQPIRSVFQEPCFTSSDKAFLEARGHEIMESPDAYDLVEADTFLYGLHLYSDIYAEAIAKHIPAMFIGTGWDTWQECVPSSVPRCWPKLTRDSCSDPEAERWARIKELDGLCDQTKFPEDDEFYPIFTGTAIHWRRPAEPPNGDEVPSAPETPDASADVAKAQAALEKLTVSGP